jgi:hypothetical protein
MPDPATRFIELATRPLEGEAREIAAVELAARLAHGKPDEATLSAATARLAAAQPAAAGALFWIAGATVVFLAIALCRLVPEHWEEGRLLEWIHGQGRDWKHHERVLAAMGPAAADVPLWGHWNPEQRKEQVEALLQEDPSDPARYFLAVDWYGTVSHDAVPADYPARWKQIDPANALWPLQDKDVFYPGTLILIREAADCERFQSYAAPINQRQLRSLPPDGTLKRLHMRRVLSGFSEIHDSSWLNQFVKNAAQTAAIQRTVGDEHGLRELIQNLRKVLRMVLQDEAPGMSVVYLEPGNIFKLVLIAGSTGLAEEAAWLKRLQLAVTTPRTLRSTTLLSHASSLVKLDFHYNHLAFPMEDLEPGRRAEYAVADRFGAVAMALVGFLLLVACTIALGSRGAAARGLSRGLMPLFRRSDRVWLIGVGVVFPLLWWIGIVGFSPLGCRDIGLNYYGFRSVSLMQPWLSQTSGGMVFLLVMLFQTGRWRWGKRAGFLVLRAERMWIGWTMALVAALFIPAQGIVRLLPDHQAEFLLYASAAGGIPLLWLLWRAAMGLFVPREQALGGQLLLRVLVPCLILIPLLMLAAVPWLRNSEHHWVDRDELVKIAPSGISGLEKRCVDPIRLRLLEAIR